MSTRTTQPIRILRRDDEFVTMDGPWPDARKFPTVRRLFAWWRWESEGHRSAADNARASYERRVAALGVEP